MADPAAFLDLLARAELRSAAGDWAEAAELWARVTEANPVHGDYWARLAEARYAERDFAAAAPAYAKVLELGVRPEYQVRFRADAPEFLPGEAAYLIACCQAELGHREDAIDALAAALGRGFRDLDRAQADDCWQAWRDDERLRDLLGIVEVEGLSRDEGQPDPDTLPPLVGSEPTITQPLRSTVSAVVRPTPPGQPRRCRLTFANSETWPCGVICTIVVPVPCTFAFGRCLHPWARAREHVGSDRGDSPADNNYRHREPGPGQRRTYGYKGQGWRRWAWHDVGGWLSPPARPGSC
jgi:hypothetical protein